ncbi:5-(carboxyamino)imidazole ribonucleotide mutase [Candidatus Eisenbacteria bacterium]|uniref:N5-carboxyaminoimidazole ribonucleotide mutase n=1 Tax=Eiseniibacteriota bacterium TaxID=2212470 RepID=A0ABV6YJA3_UNCEI
MPSKGKTKVARKSAEKPLVGLIYASTTDEPVMKACGEVLARFGIPFETSMFSAHRQPSLTARYAKSARRRGLKVLIAGAGMAAHLPGVLASMTSLPVIGVPLSGSSFGGADALLAMVQMPAGVPVATLAAGKAGAKNAAVLAAQILALSDDGVARKMDRLKRRMEAGEKL